jgi:hypothetical protein
MGSARRYGLVVVSAIVALAIASAAHAQSSNGKGKGNGKGQGHKSTPPSSVPIAAPTRTSASPLSWIDDASLLTPGSMSLTISALHWSGADLSELDVPIVDAAAGLSKRLQLGATIPHVVGNADGTAPIGGLGTSYISGKVGLLTGPEVKFAVTPVVEILGEGAMQALPAGEGRYQLGLPVSLGIEQGSVRVFAATGFFTRGAWFAGAGTGFQMTPRTAASLSFTRSWAKTDVDGVRDRRELSGGVSRFLTDQIAVYGSVGHTIATLDENGAGMSISGGLTFFLKPALTK